MKGLNSTPTTSETPILDRLAILGDPIRCRALLILERNELTVTELCTVLQLPQSTASRHLKVLADDGLVEARKDGTSRRYSAVPLPRKAAAGRLWRLVRDDFSDNPIVGEDRRRLESVLARRRNRSREFFSESAADWAALRGELFGRRFDLEAMLGLLDESWVVGDLGAGTGQLAESLAPWVARVIAVDDSPEMLEAAARRLEGTGNVEIRNGRLEALPFDDGVLDVATLALVLHHVAEPGLVLAEAARALKPGGKILVLDMAEHEREEFRHEMGHVWLGFPDTQMISWLQAAGLERARVRHLRPEPDAKGPSLFAATAVKPDGRRIDFSTPEDPSTEKENLS